MIRIFTFGAAILLSFCVWSSNPPKAKLLEEKIHYVPTTECALGDICDLKGVGFHLVRFSFPHVKSYTTEVEYGTTLYAWYDTKDHSTLEKYVFVQLIRGCHIETNTYRGMTTRHFAETFNNGSITPFCFPEWIIDRTDDDPVYSSEPCVSRHFYAQWAPYVHDEFPASGQTKNYGEEKPSTPRLGMLDWPAVASVRRWENGRVQANSVHLEFRTCLYREKDIPKTFRKSIDLLPPSIACYEWKYAFAYDTKSETIVARDFTIDSCKETDISRSIEQLRSSQRAAAPPLKFK